MKGNEKTSGRGWFVGSILELTKRKWLILIKCSFLATIISGVVSVTILHLGIMQFNNIAPIVNISALTMLSLTILGMVGFVLKSNETLKSVGEKYESTLQEALGTDRHYCAWIDRAKEMKAAESIILRDLNPVLLIVTLFVGIFNLAYIFNTFPNIHPFYPLIAPQALSTFLAIVFLYGRRLSA